MADEGNFVAPFCRANERHRRTNLMLYTRVLATFQDQNTQGYSYGKIRNELRLEIKQIAEVEWVVRIY